MTFDRRIRRPRRQTGAAAILAMMFLVIFGSLAAAMAIVAQGNLATADTQLKINRSLAAAETGMRFVMYRLSLVTPNIKTRDGMITTGNAPALWVSTRDALMASMSNEFHNLSEPRLVGTSLVVGPIAVGPGQPTFTATFTPHPITGENYDSAYYQRPPYNQLTPAVSSAAPLDSTWVRVRVEASDGPSGHAVTRGIQVDLKIDRKIKFAILSKSRVMLGRNVHVEGPVGSKYLEAFLNGGHPVQMMSDFRGLSSTLDSQLDTLTSTLITNDLNGDNRINLGSASETAGITNPAQYDGNSDGFIDDYDFFLKFFDTGGTGRVTATDMTNKGVAAVRAQEMVALIDLSGDPSRPGFNDGIIDNNDDYSKIKGQVMISSDMATWNNGAADGHYQDYFQGPIHPDYNASPLTFSASDNNLYQYGPADFDVSSLKNRATGDLASQATAQAANWNPQNPNSPQPLGTVVRESVPYNSAHPYDYYDRPVYQNMTFSNVMIPKGTNAVFKNCTFIGVTFVESDTHNTDPNYNFAGMQEADGSQKYPSMTANVNGTTVANTKTVSNNVRFEGCSFEGGIVSDATSEYTHVRNKIAFTGTVRFNIDNSTNLSTADKTLFKRSTILTPHYSVEMGPFINAASANENIKLTGTIVAGIIDIRGNVDVQGTILTTFQPQSNSGPVAGSTSPQFNTTLGYFSSGDGDLEAELPPDGLGVIHIRYDPTIPLPDGILGPISVTPDYATYFETGAQ